MKEFLKSGEAESYQHVHIQWIPRRKPVFIIYQDDGTPIEDIELSLYTKRDELHQLFQDKGFVLKDEVEIQYIKRTRALDRRDEDLRKELHKLQSAIATRRYIKMSHKANDDEFESKVRQLDQLYFERLDALRNSAQHQDDIHRQRQSELDLKQNHIQSKRDLYEEYTAKDRETQQASNRNDQKELQDRWLKKLQEEEQQQQLSNEL